MKLNVGCGAPRGIYKTDEWMNVDTYGSGIKTSANFKEADILNLPFESRSFEEVRAIHVLEHINRNHSVQALKECYRVLKPNGVLYVEVPDFKRVIKNLYEAFVREEKSSVHIWTTSIYGKQRYDGDAHHWGYTEDLLLAQMNMVGKWKELDREVDMISDHHKSEPVILIKGIKA